MINAQYFHFLSSGTPTDAARPPLDRWITTVSYPTSSRWVSRVTCHDQSQCLVQESLASPDTEEQVPFEAGVKRGKVFVPVLSAEEEAAQLKRAEIAEKVKLEADEEAALASASLKDSAANRLIGEVVQSRRRPLLGPSPG